MKKNISSKFMVLCILVFMFALSNMTVADAAIGYFHSFTVSFTGGEKYTGSVMKEGSQNAAINLKGDGGDAWVTGTVRNSDNAYRGSTNVQRGKRAEFSTSAQSGFMYKLGVKKTYNTGGGSVTINGSWKP